MTQEDACWSRWKKGSRRITSARKDSTRLHFGPTVTSSTARRSARLRSRKWRRPCLAWRKVLSTPSRDWHSGSSGDTTAR
eukprot:10776770-Heterocapsa_arctica.AAC.1